MQELSMNVTVVDAAGFPLSDIRADVVQNVRASGNTQFAIVKLNSQAVAQKMNGVERSLSMPWSNVT
jgi:hypothetical protein